MEFAVKILCWWHLHDTIALDASSSPTSMANYMSQMVSIMNKLSALERDPLRKPMSIVFVGCGLWGSATNLSRKYEAECCGIRISLVSAKRAQALAIAQGLASMVSFQVADAMDQSFSWKVRSGH
ncbi:gamma-tocopherol methyltransferase [Tanacetum coccineum]